MIVPERTIELIRTASRRLVRELGFMNSSLAGTDLPPSAVHALIEIDERHGITGGELAEILHLEKSSVSRMLRKLILSGDILETLDEYDARTKILSLTNAGQRRVAVIHDFARTQVANAVGQLPPAERQIVVNGLQLYGTALAMSGSSELIAPKLDIVTGYQPGLIARIVDMHIAYYSRTSAFGQPFESTVASGLAEFCDRLGRSGNEIWLAVQDGQIIGSIAIDGEDLGNGIAHLRWFILDESARGIGIGRKLLGSAMAFVDEKDFAKTHLWTFAGLSAARHLYESFRFKCVEERLGNQWGCDVLEQLFARARS